MKSELSITIGARIKHFRELAGLTQLELSGLIPCEPSTLAHYETGKNLISMTRLERVAQVLQVPAHLFLIKQTSTMDKDLINSIIESIKTANPVQLGLIHNIITSTLELTDLK